MGCYGGLVNGRRTSPTGTVCWAPHLSKLLGERVGEAPANEPKQTMSWDRFVPCLSRWQRLEARWTSVILYNQHFAMTTTITSSGLSGSIQ
jgi:hypothetical protein